MKISPGNSVHGVNTELKIPGEILMGVYFFVYLCNIFMIPAVFILFKGLIQVINSIFFAVFSTSWEISGGRAIGSRHDEKKSFLTGLFLILSFGLAEAGQKIMAVQSMRVKPYEEAMRGFKSVANFEINRLILAESEGADLIKKINKVRPDVVLSIGMEALSKLKTIKNIPIVYLMVLNPQSLIEPDRNISGVSMIISPARQLKALLKVLPEVKRVGFYMTRKFQAVLSKKQKMLPESSIFTCWPGKFTVPGKSLQR